MTKHRIGTQEEWRVARVELLEREKELSRRSDELARQRRELPWVPVEKDYSFETDEGTKSLAQLFDGRSQLLVYHFMFGFGFRVNDETEGCTGCSFVADHFDGALPHLHARDVTLVCASIAPLGRLHAYKERMGWAFPWVSSLGSDFSYDFGVAFSDEQQRQGAEYNFQHVEEPVPQKEGLSAFAIDAGMVHAGRAAGEEDSRSFASEGSGDRAADRPTAPIDHGVLAFEQHVCLLNSRAPSAEPREQPGERGVAVVEAPLHA